jgi:hypothetical protein
MVRQRPPRPTTAMPSMGSHISLARLGMTFQRLSCSPGTTRGHMRSRGNSERRAPAHGRAPRHRASSRSPPQPLARVGPQYLDRGQTRSSAVFQRSWSECEKGVEGEEQITHCAEGSRTRWVWPTEVLPPVRQSVVLAYVRVRPVKQFAGCG